PPGAPPAVEPPFTPHQIKTRLQHSPPADQYLLDALRLASGLVIRDPQCLGLRVLFDEVDRSAKPESSVDHDVTTNAVLIPFARHRAERKLEIDRQPLFAVAREVLEPRVQGPPDRRALRLPYTFDRRHQLVVRMIAHMLDHFVQHGARCVDRGAGHGQLSSRLQRAEGARLNRLAPTAPRQTIHIAHPPLGSARRSPRSLLSRTERRRLSLRLSR